MSDKIVKKKSEAIRKQKPEKPTLNLEKYNIEGAKSEGTWWWCNGRGKKFLYTGRDPQTLKNKFTLDGTCEGEMRWYTFDGGIPLNWVQLVEQHGHEEFYRAMENPGLVRKQFSRSKQPIPGHLRHPDKKSMKKYPQNIWNLTPRNNMVKRTKKTEQKINNSRSAKRIVKE